MKTILNFRALLNPVFMVVLFLIALCAAVLLLGKDFNPYSYYLEGHDEVSEMPAPEFNTR